MGPKRRVRARYGLLALLLVLAPWLLVTPGLAQAASLSVRLAVIVHPSLLEDDIPLETLRHIFLGEQQFWQDRSRVTLFLHPPGTPEREAVLRSVYRMSEAEFRRYWVAKLFRAEAATGPKVLQSTEAIARLVAGIPGAVAIVPAPNVPEGVKVLRVNGQLPASASYPLRQQPRR